MIQTDSEIFDSMMHAAMRGGGGLPRVAAEMGVKAVIATEAHDDMNKQLADVEDLLSKNIDVLILNPKDPKGLVPATKAATVDQQP